MTVRFKVIEVLLLSDVNVRPISYYKTFDAHIFATMLHLLQILILLPSRNDY